jgi:hypothetical protein
VCLEGRTGDADEFSGVRRMRITFGRNHEEPARRDTPNKVVDVEVFGKSWDDERHLETNALRELMPK